MGEATHALRMVHSPRRTDLVGVVLAMCTAAWFGIAGAIRGGRPLPMAALVLAFVLTVVAVRRLTAIRAIPVMLAIGAAPVVISVVARVEPLALDPLGYSNASGALYLVSAGGLLIARCLVERLVVRRLLEVAALVWLTMPLLATARTATLFAALVGAAVLLVRRSGTGRVLLRVGASGLVSVAIVTVVVGASKYTPVGRSGLLHRIVDTSIGELRILLWREAVDLVQMSPFVGVGPRRFSDVSTLAAERPDALWVHNEYLQSAAETGVPGGMLVLLVALWAFAYLLHTAGDLRTLPAVIVLTGITVNASIDYILHFPAVPLLLAALVGGAAGLDEIGSNTDRRDGIRLSRHRLLATLMLWALLLLPAAPLNPESSVTNQASWTQEPSGVVFTGIGGLWSLEPPTRLYEQLDERGELSIELLLATHSLDQTGPARIISASDGTSRRNFTVGQQDGQFVFRLRGKASDPNAIDGQIEVEGAFDALKRQHIVVTADRERVQVYLDGRLVSQDRGPRDPFGSWDHGYPLLLGNESTGNRGWAGEIFLAAVYDHVLGAEEVEARHADLGIDTTPARTMRAPLLLHTFDAPEGRLALDRGSLRPGTHLSMPQRFPAPPDGLTTLTDVERWAGSRLAGHALLFGVWIAVVLGRRRSTSVKDAAVGVGFGSLLILAATVVRYADGRGPTVVDLVGAALGCTVVAAVILARRQGGLVPLTPRGNSPL